MSDGVRRGLRALVGHVQSLYDNYRAVVLQRLIDLVDEYMAITGRTTYVNIQHIAENMLYAEYENYRIDGSETRETLYIVLRNGATVCAKKKTVYKECRLIDDNRVHCTPLQPPKTEITVDVDW